MKSNRGTENGRLPRKQEDAVSEPKQNVHREIDKELHTTLLTGVEALEGLQTGWAELWRTDPTATPFQHPAWLLPWARQFGPDGVVQAVQQRNDGGRLLGLLPLFAYREPSQDTHKLLLLGTGTTDYLGGVFQPVQAPSLAEAALRFALTEIPAWNRLDLLQLRVDSPLLEAGRGMGSLETSEAESCAIVFLNQALPGKVDSNVRRYHRRAEIEGPLLFTIASNQAEAEDFFEELVRLHRERWEIRQEAGVLDDPRVLKHHREALPALLKAGLLRLVRLRCGEDTVAVLYALADPVDRPLRRLYLYLIGIEMRRSHLSPGTLILHAVWEYARREGFAQLDLLRGGERYKEFWGAVSTATHALHAAR